MVTDKPAYDQLLDYLTSNKAVFSDHTGSPLTDLTIESIVEEQISSQVIALCTQHETLESNHRSIIIREIDGIVYDMQQILLEYWSHNATEQQKDFLIEFATLIKNIFDSEVAALLD
jgi:hypothetical protein